MNVLKLLKHTQSRAAGWVQAESWSSCLYLQAQARPGPRSYILRPSLFPESEFCFNNVPRTQVPTTTSFHPTCHFSPTQFSTCKYQIAWSLHSQTTVPKVVVHCYIPRAVLGTLTPRSCGWSLAARLGHWPACSGVAPVPATVLLSAPSPGPHCQQLSVPHLMALGGICSWPSRSAY